MAGDKWRYVKIGSEGIAIKPDTGDLKTDMQTIAMCGLNEVRARLIASAPGLAEALETIVSYNLDIIAGRINYRPEDHIEVAMVALTAAGRKP